MRNSFVPCSLDRWSVRVAGTPVCYLLGLTLVCSLTLAPAPGLAQEAAEVIVEEPPPGMAPDVILVAPPIASPVVVPVPVPVAIPEAEPVEPEGPSPAEQATLIAELQRHRSSQPRLELGAKLLALGMNRSTTNHGEDPDEASDPYTGVGLMVRLRPSHFYGLQLDVEALRAMEPEDSTQRDLLTVSGSFLAYFSHTERFELYGLWGLGSATSCWSAAEDDCDYGRGVAFGFHTGLGAQFVFGRHFRLFGEVRLQLLAEYQGRDASPDEERRYYLPDEGYRVVTTEELEPGSFVVPSASFGATFGF